MQRSTKIPGITIHKKTFLNAATTWSKLEQEFKYPIQLIESISAQLQYQCIPKIYILSFLQMYQEEHQNLATADFSVTLYSPFLQHFTNRSTRMATNYGNSHYNTAYFWLITEAGLQTECMTSLKLSEWHETRSQYSTWAEILPSQFPTYVPLWSCLF